MLQIFLHGLGQTAECWDKLNVPGRRICPDLADILQGKPAVYPNLYEAFASICSKTQERIDLCGLSLGGVLALQYAIEHPDQVRSLILIAPQYKMPRLLLKLQNIVFRCLPQSSFRQTGFDRKSFIQLCRTMQDLDFSKSVSQIECPVLIVCGENDRANSKAAIKLSNLIKDSRLEIIPGAGHEVNQSDPEKLSKVISRFYLSH